MGSLFDKGENVSTNTSESTNSMYQQEYFDKLLGGASDWYEKGGLSGGPNYMSQMGDILGQMGQGYQDMISGAGSADRYQALLDTQKASADISQKALDKSLMNIQSSAGAAGQAGSSRQGLAQGVAAGESASNLAALQAQQNQAYLDKENSIKQAGLSGMGNLLGQVGSYQEMAQGNTDQATQLKNLMALQSLISGNMGGTTSSTGTQTTPGNSMFDNILGGAAAVGGMMMMSDKKLKKKIKKVKTKDGKKVKTKDGIDVAEWEWNDKAEKEYGLKGKEKGVIAQEAEKKRPDAVLKDKKGTRAVNYGKLM